MADNGKTECEETVEAAGRLVERMQDKAMAALLPDNPNPEQAYVEVLEELETAPEVTVIREATGRDPKGFGSH